MRRTMRLTLAVVLGAALGATLTLAFLGSGESPEPPATGPPHARSPAPAPAVRSPAGSPSPALGQAPVPTLLAWTPGRLPDGYADAVGADKGMKAVALVRSGFAWLTSWRDADEPPRRPPAGFRVPVEVAAIRPAQYVAFVPPAERPDFAQLGRGEALMGRTGAGIRGIGPGGTLSFGATTVRVRTVVDDELIGAHEVVVNVTTGQELGIVRPRYLLVSPDRGVSRRRAERVLRGPLPAGARIRVRGPGETPVFRHGDAVLPPVRLKELFGEFAAVPNPDGTLRMDPGWVAENVPESRLPLLGMVRCHRQLLPQLRGALGELVRRGLGDLVNPADSAGCYSPRFIAFDPGTGLSHHTWGVAVDINVSENPFGGEPRQDPRLVEVFERWGLTWGGRWLIPDGMHFEFLEFPLSPRD